MAAVRFLPGLILLVPCFYWVSAFGEEIPIGQPLVPETVEPAKEAISADEGYVDRSHAYFDRNINQVVTWFDGLFGDTAVRDEKKADIRLKWSNDLRLEKGEGLKYRNSFRAYVRLPKFEKKLRLVIMEDTSTDAVAPIPSDPGTPVANTPTQTNSLRAANTELRYYVHETKTGYAFLAVGSRFAWLPETFARTRILWRHTLADNTFITPSVTPFWQDHIGFGVTPQLDIGHPFPRGYIFLWSNLATLYKNRSGFLWGSEVSLSRILSPVTALAFAVGATGSTRPSAVGDRFNMGVNNYKVTVKYRRNIYKPWLFLELVPETNWRRVESAERKIVPAFTVRLEINSEGRRALLPVPQIVKEPIPIRGLH
ncbi:MAG: hypothetical protein WBM29_12515 [Candidatus Deferrimicrobium sp.]